MSCIASSGERSNILRNRSFTLFKNDRDLRETSGADRDVVSVWDHVGLLFVETFRSRFEHFVVLERKETKFLFDTTTDLPLFSGRERVSSLRRDPHQIHCKDTTSQIPIEGWREAERKFSWVGTVCNTSSPESIKMPVVPTGRRKNKLAMYIACSLKSQIRSALCALGESWGSEKLQWTKRDGHQFVVECVSNGVHTALRRRSNRLHHWRLQQRRNHRWKLKHRHPFSFHLDAFHLSRQKSELLKARVKHARKCIKTVAAGRRGARAGRFGCTQVRNCWSTRSSWWASSAKPLESHRWSRHFVPVFAPQSEPLEIREEEHTAVLSLWIVYNYVERSLFLHNWDFTCALGCLLCNDLFLMDLVVHGRTSQGKRWTTTCGARVSTTILKNCGPKPHLWHHITPNSDTNFCTFFGPSNRVLLMEAMKFWAKVRD